MKQLRNFSNRENGGAAKNAGSSGVTPDALMDEAMRKYGGMNENALIARLLSSVREQRQNGTYDEAQLLNFANLISPHLDETQRGKLEGIIGMLGENGQD